MRNLFILGLIAATGYAVWRVFKDVKHLAETPDYTYDDDIIDDKPKK